MPYAWVEDNRIRDIAPGDPAELYHPDIAALYSTEVSEEVQRGAELIEGKWENPPEPDPSEPDIPEPDPVDPPAPVVSPVAFKLLFTVTERVAIKNFRADTSEETADARAVIDDLYEIIDDPRLTEISLEHSDTVKGVTFLEAQGLIGSGRAAEILAGQAPA